VLPDGNHADNALRQGSKITGSLGLEPANLMLRTFFILMLRAWIVALLVLSGCANSGPPVGGVWVLRYEGKNLMVLTLDKDGMHGTLAAPQHFEVSSDAIFTKISDKAVEHSGQAHPVGKDLSFKSDDSNELLLHVNPDGGLEARPADLPLFASSFAPWIFTRVPDGEHPQVATDWTKTVTPEIRAVQDKLKEMVTEDQALRNAPTISVAAMTAMTAKHRPDLERIHKIYGWPKQSQFGRETAAAFWLLVQHQAPEVQRAWLPEIARLVDQQEASRQDYALLFDRVQKGLGKPQRWGTQTSCVNGRAVLDPVEDPANLDARRRELNLQPEQEYLKLLQEACAKMRP